MKPTTLFAAGLFSVLCAHAADTVNNVEFKPIFDSSTGLELHVQNYSKLPKTISGVEVFIGGTADKAACRIAVKGIFLPPAARMSVVVADMKAVNGCLPRNAPVRASHKLQGLQNIPLKTGSADTTPLKFDRAVRVVPHFTGTGILLVGPQQLEFQLAQ